MPAPSGLSREDSRTIGFVAKCLGCEAIDLGELHQWCFQLIRDHEISELPDYVMELAEFEGPFAKVFNVIGFVPDADFAKRDEAALYGIAARRGRQPFDWPVKPEAALRALQERPQIAARFRETFPFIQF